MSFSDTNIWPFCNFGTHHDQPSGLDFAENPVSPGFVRFARKKKARKFAIARIRPIFSEGSGCKCGTLSAEWGMKTVETVARWKDLSVTGLKPGVNVMACLRMATGGRSMANGGLRL